MLLGVKSGRRIVTERRVWRVELVCSSPYKLWTHFHTLCDSEGSGSSAVGQLGPGFEGVVSDVPPPHPGSSAGGRCRGERRARAPEAGVRQAWHRAVLASQGVLSPVCSFSHSEKLSRLCGFYWSTWNAVGLPLWDVQFRACSRLKESRIPRRGWLTVSLARRLGVGGVTVALLGFGAVAMALSDPHLG